MFIQCPTSFDPHFRKSQIIVFFVMSLRRKQTAAKAQVKERLGPDEFKQKERGKTNNGDKRLIQPFI